MTTVRVEMMMIYSSTTTISYPSCKKPLKKNPKTFHHLTASIISQYSLKKTRLEVETEQSMDVSARSLVLLDVALIEEFVLCSYSIFELR